MSKLIIKIHESSQSSEPVTYRIESMYYDGNRKFLGYNKNGIYREYVGSKITNTDALLEVMTTVTGYGGGFRVILIDSPNKGLPCFTLEGPKNREWVVNFELTTGTVQDAIAELEQRGVTIDV